MSTSFGWEGKGRYGSLRERMYAGCAGETVKSLENLCCLCHDFFSLLTVVLVWPNNAVCHNSWQRWKYKLVMASSIPLQAVPVDFSHYRLCCHFL